MHLLRVLQLLHGRARPLLLLLLLLVVVVCKLAIDYRNERNSPRFPDPGIPVFQHDYMIITVLANWSFHFFHLDRNTITNCFYALTAQQFFCVQAIEWQESYQQFTKVWTSTIETRIQLAKSPFTHRPYTATASFRRRRPRSHRPHLRNGIIAQRWRHWRVDTASAYHCATATVYSTTAYSHIQTRKHLCPNHPLVIPPYN